MRKLGSWEIVDLPETMANGYSNYVIAGKHLPIKIVLLTVALLCLGGVQARAARAVTIAIAGDSTVATYPDSNPQHGWGQYVQAYFKSPVRVVNLAKGGRSSKTFLSEGLWQQTLDTHANYILIQFGHNDSHDANQPEHTDAEGEFAANLTRMVKEARAHNSIPVLVTPVMRRTAEDALLPYSDSMKRVAAEQRAVLIDLHDLSGRYYKTLTPEELEKLQKQGDKTHFSASGAQTIAAIVLHELVIVVPALDPLLAHHNTK